MVELKEIESQLLDETIQMITDFFNFHRKLTNAPKEFWTTYEESKETLKEWRAAGTVFQLFCEGMLAGFVYLKFGGQKAAWLEDIYISEEFRGKGLGKKVMKQLDRLLEDKGVLSMFVDVIPRNKTAIHFYRECGFDHLNMIQLRKNYNPQLNKDEDVEILGFQFKKY